MAIFCRCLCVLALCAGGWGFSLHAAPGEDGADPRWVSAVADGVGIDSAVPRESPLHGGRLGREVGDYWAELGVGNIVSAALFLAFTLFFRKLLLDRLLRRLRGKVGSGDFLRALEGPISALILLGGAYCASRFLIFHPEGLRLASQLFHGLNFLLFAWLLTRLSDAFFDGQSRRIRYQQSEYFGVLPLLKRSCRFLIACVGVLLMVDSLGFSVTGIFATLGIGGALVAFAAKDSVANIFGSLSIVLDRPFKLGDWVQIRGGAIDGNVEQIGLRSTKIRTLAKTLVSVPNALLTNDYIDNWSRMAKRRVRQLISIAPNATAEQIHAFSQEVEAILRRDSGVHPDIIFCALAEFEPTAIQVLVCYFTLAIETQPHMRVRHRINCQIFASARRLGLAVSTPLELRTVLASRAGEGQTQIPSDLA